MREQIAFYRKGWFYKQKQDDTKSDCMIHSLVRKIKSLEPKNKGKELKLQIKKIGMATVFLTNFIRCRTSFRML
ncbi:hypothetical protein NNN12_12165, partial [Enterococcus faecium]|nr:hypothetical protein [Enterococcus faecium]